ncbi:phage tail tape measure protein [Kitasatospora sp. NPDC004615]|uniref:phage tail tape measure protein n=1 Tax=Kitasatospora sp. NPDC004615 TaxID=3364017 RepID=UPI0036A2E833
MPTVGYASLQIIPSVRGIGAEIRDQLAGPVEEGGDKAGEGFAKKLGGSLKVGLLAAGALGGAALVAGIGEAMDQQVITGKLKAQLGATGEDAKKYGQIAGQMYASAVTEDVAGAADAIRSTMSAGLLPPDATNQQIQSIATKVSDLAGTFELDLGQAANAVGQMMKTGLAPNAESALDTITRGLQVMGPRADDLGDTFNEYSTIFRQMGLSAEQATGLLAQGMQAGARDTDVVADSLKEFVLIAQGGGDSVNEAFKAVGLSGKEMQKAFIEGGPGAASALDQVFDRLRAIKDPVERNTAALGLFGTKNEDVQKALLALDPSSAVATLGQVGGAAAGMGDSLRDNASARLTEFTRTIQQNFVNVVGGQVLPVLADVGGQLVTTFGPAFGEAAGWAKDHLLPAMQDAGGWMKDNLVPALSDAAHFVRDDMVPALQDFSTWLSDNKTTIEVVAGVITTLLLPVLITTAVGYAQTGIAATVSGAQQVAAWVASGVQAVRNGALSVAASYQTVGGWIAAGASAVVSGAQQVAAWIATGARATWGMILQLAASATVVGGWVLMGTQSLIQAARMAAAWIMAMGPIGWITVAVIAIVALIIAYWDEIKAATLAAWDWVVDKVKWVGQFLLDLFMNWSLPGLLIKHWDDIKSGAQAAWDWVVDFVKAIPGRMWNIFLNWSLPGLLIKHWDSIKQGAIDGWNTTIDWIKGVPGWITDAFSGFGTLLLDKGGDLVRGLWDGIKRMGGWLRDKLIGWAKDAIPGPIADALGIHSPSRVMRDQIGRWIPAGIVQGIDAGSPAVEAAMAGLVVPPTIPDWMLQEAAPVSVGVAAAYTTTAGAPTGSVQGAALQIENYWESDSGNPRRVAVELQMLSKGRG